MSIFKSGATKETIRLLKKNSLRLITPWKVRCGYDGDDFVRDVFTCVGTSFAVKVPRIIKNMLLKRLSTK